MDKIEIKDSWGDDIAFEGLGNGKILVSIFDGAEAVILTPDEITRLHRALGEFIEEHKR